MELTSFLSRLGDLKSKFNSNSKLARYFRFDCDIPFSTLKQWLNLGWWHILPFAFNAKRKTVYGLRVMPGKEWEKWPVTCCFDGNHCGTYAPNIEAFFYVVNVEALIKSKGLFNSIANNWQAFKALGKEVEGYFNWAKCLQDLEIYIQDSKNIPKESNNWKSSQWAQCIRLVDGENDYRSLVDIQDKMLKNNSLIPEINEEEFGIWKSWALNLTAARMVTKAINYPDDYSGSVMWQGFIQPTGIDPCDIVFSHFPNRTYDPYMGAYEIANVLGAPSFKNEEIKNDPLYPAVSSILKHGKHGYKGLEHLMAGKEFQTADSFAERAWDAYLSAAYWSGKNKSETNIDVWKQSIFLCEKESWKDAEAALKHLRQFYKTP